MPKKDDKKTKKGIRQGRYIPKNPHKYRGDPHNIIYRSSWEYRVCVRLDLNENVVECFLERHPEFSPVRIENPLTGQASDCGLTIEPPESNGNGMFVAKLQMRG